ncbi:MAG: hypothetical protein AB1696_24650 [Planctomycetota bacterium]
MPDFGTFISLSEGLSAGQIAVCIIMLVGVFFWLWFMPVMILFVIIAAVYRAFFGLSTVTWLGVEDPDQMAVLVLKAARGEPLEDNEESGILRRMR